MITSLPESVWCSEEFLRVNPEFSSVLRALFVHLYFLLLWPPLPFLHDLSPQENTVPYIMRVSVHCFVPDPYKVSWNGNFMAVTAYSVHTQCIANEAVQTKVWSVSAVYRAVTRLDVKGATICLFKQTWISLFIWYMPWASQKSFSQEGWAWRVICAGIPYNGNSTRTPVSWNTWINHESPLTSGFAFK